MTNIESIIRALQAIYWNADIPGSRNKADVFGDRITMAATEATLAGCLEMLMRSLNVSLERFPLEHAPRILAVNSSEDGGRILQWIRENSRMACMLAMSKDTEAFREALDSIQLPVANVKSACPARLGFTIPITATCEAPLAHGSDEKAGNATLFRRIKVLCPNGASLHLPYYAGNAVRGQMRDLLADDYLTLLGLRASRSRPPVAMWFFYALYSGGALEEKSEATKAITKELGDNGATRSDGIRGFRLNVPPLSLLGCALGNRVLPGRVQVADLRPTCREWGTGDVPAASLMVREYLTRREDCEDHIENHSMIANTECLRSGTVLEGGVDMDQSLSEIEKACLGRGLELIAKRGLLGAENRRGFGRVKFQIENTPDSTPYVDMIKSKRSEIIGYLQSIGAISMELGL
jgi:hypothetical protein